MFLMEERYNNIDRGIYSDDSDGRCSDEIYSHEGSFEE